MSDEIKKEATTEEHVSWAERSAQAREDARTSAFHKKQKIQNKNSMSDEMMEWAKKTIPLKDIEAFKAYAYFEALQTAEALGGAFKDQGFLPATATYGEKMAFNHGVYMGMLKLKNERERLWKSYISLINQQQGEPNENEKN